MTILLKNYSVKDFLNDYAINKTNLRILNAGSSSVRLGSNSVNVDIQSKPDVDVVCDIHDLPESLGAFDVVICNGVLQYCTDPKQVAKQFLKVLKEGGYLFIDAPWIQPYCPDSPDRFRFSEDGLRTIFSDFQVVKIGPSIRAGSAFAYLGVSIAKDLTSNKYLNFVLARVAFFILYPLRVIKTTKEEKTAGAFYMICRKSTQAATGAGGG